MLQRLEQFWKEFNAEPDVDRRFELLVAMCALRFDPISNDWIPPLFGSVRPNCVLCGTRQEATPHHVIPRSRGGFNRWTNVAQLCRACHVEVHREADLRKVSIGLNQSH